MVYLIRCHTLISNYRFFLDSQDFLGLITLFFFNLFLELRVHLVMSNWCWNGVIEISSVGTYGFAYPLNALCLPVIDSWIFFSSIVCLEVFKI